ncbi:ABC transporter ATP-binding protein [Neobacillus niacini]|uniref:ABC transporter ATP-binding protein n=1 Tax=Neobacillus niacini TaxID=86668 RepID=UPI00052F5D96|nr:ABC transporter ATP-binding protein [Neobacillus niacini]KGM44768.1 nitrate ABC transporter ATP-binding protein [Neobacillus niacini]MEC1525472.1 ABC transporter ATP-binding protein [Neobacillus niacini]
MAYLSLQDVTYSYAKNNMIVDAVNFDVEKGKFHSLLGKSGCGKTTLLKLAAGLFTPNKGCILFQGEEIKPSEKIGFVFQAPTLLEWKTVVDNVLLPVSLKRKVTREQVERAESLLESMGLTHLKQEYPTRLSGGQQSRVSIARALIGSPSLLYMDEPFSALDAITREELQDDLLHLCEVHQMTVLFVTHDISEAVYLSDNIAVMDKGSIIKHFSVNLPDRHSTDFRYSGQFSQLCLEIRTAISGGQR